MIFLFCAIFDNLADYMIFSTLLGKGMAFTAIPSPLPPRGQFPLFSGRTFFSYPAAPSGGLSFSTF